MRAPCALSRSLRYTRMASVNLSSRMPKKRRSFESNGLNVASHLEVLVQIGEPFLGQPD